MPNWILHAQTEAQICIFMFSHPCTHTHTNNMKAIITQKYALLSNYGIFPPQNSSEFEKPEFWIVSPTAIRQMFVKELFTGTSCSWHPSFISPQVHVYNGASKSWKSDLIWLHCKHFLKQGYSHRGSSTECHSLSVFTWWQHTEMVIRQTVLLIRCCQQTVNW